jgi:hypothetical protein
MAKRYILIEDNESNNNATGCLIAMLVGAIILAIVFIIVFILSPGILIVTIINSIIDIQIGTLWAFSIIFSLVILGLLYFLYQMEFFKYYLIGCIVISTVGILITLIYPKNIFYNTIKVMFGEELPVCGLCKGDGCVKEDEIKLTYTIDSLKTAKEVGDFQDWLDKNHPFWLKNKGQWKNLRYGTIEQPTRHINGKGFGLKGEYTQIAFKNWGNEFMKYNLLGPCKKCNMEVICK